MRQKFLKQDQGRRKEKEEKRKRDRKEEREEGGSVGIHKSSTIVWNRIYQKFINLGINSQKE